MAFLFGRSSYDAGVSRTVREKIYGSLYALSGEGTVDATSMTVYSETSGGNNTWKLAIYDASYNLVGSTEERSIGYDDWFTFDFASPLTLTRGQSYYLVAWSSNENDGGYVSGYGYSVGAGRYQDIDYSTAGGSFPDPLDQTSHDRLVSIYVNYSPGWTGKLCGVSNPGKVNGIASTNIGKIIGA